MKRDTTGRTDSSNICRLHPFLDISNELQVVQYDQAGPHRGIKKALIPTLDSSFFLSSSSNNHQSIKASKATFKPFQSNNIFTTFKVSTFITFQSQSSKWSPSLKSLSLPLLLPLPPLPLQFTLKLRSARLPANGDSAGPRVSRLLMPEPLLSHHTAGPTPGMKLPSMLHSFF